MNLVECVVTSVLGDPIKKGFYSDLICEYINYWEVPVEYNSYGSIGETNLTFTTEEKAKEVKEGYIFFG